MFDRRAPQGTEYELSRTEGVTRRAINANIWDEVYECIKAVVVEQPNGEQPKATWRAGQALVP